jgi:hypothetical protein
MEKQDEKDIKIQRFENWRKEQILCVCVCVYVCVCVCNHQ